MSLRALILMYLPDFCFQTEFEILTMLEQINQNISPGSVKTLVSRLHTGGVLKSRAVQDIPLRRRRSRLEYLLVKH